SHVCGACVASRTYAVHRSGLVSAILSLDTWHAHGPGDYHRSSGDHHIEPRLKSTIRGAQKNFAMDLAVVDVCVRDGRTDLFSIVPDFSAEMNSEPGFKGAIYRQPR